jgi:hypothetical protein
LPLEQKLLLLLVALAAFAAGGLMNRWIRQNRNKRNLARRFLRGSQGEHQAKFYLKKKGFHIDEEQVITQGVITIDDRPVTYNVRADYLVSKNGRRGVVEVKTGSKAVDPLYRPTRRQLLEYSALFDADDLYLFNADQKLLHRIAFDKERARPIKCKSPLRAGLLAGLLGVMLGALLSWFLYAALTGIQMPMMRFP